MPLSERVVIIDRPLSFGGPLVIELTDEDWERFNKGEIVDFTTYESDDAD